jgi:hypothetical protein
MDLLSQKKPLMMNKTGVMLDAILKNNNATHLIVFDKKSICFILLLLLLFFVLVVSKTHYSSIAIWDKIVPEYDGTKPTSKVLFSSPKFIRIDEWRVFTPFILSQVEKQFPIENYSIGPGKAPLLIGLPTAHFSSFFQPQNRGYFIFDVERGLSYSWNYGIIGLVLSTFLLLLLMTKNDFRLSVFGSLFLFFSSFIQWWGAWGPMITAFNIVLIAFINFALSKNRLIIILSSLVLILFILNFSLMLYPPFQVPLGLLMIACCVGYFLENPNMVIVKAHLKLRAFLVVVCVLSIAVVFYFFYLDVRDTIAITMNTAYPGKRMSSGGEFGIDRLFS